MMKSNLVEKKVNRTRAGYRPHTVRTKVRTLPDLPAGAPTPDGARKPAMAGPEALGLNGRLTASLPIAPLTPEPWGEYRRRHFVVLDTDTGEMRFDREWGPDFSDRPENEIWWPIAEDLTEEHQLAVVAHEEWRFNQLLSLQSGGGSEAALYVSDDIRTKLLSVCPQREVPADEKLRTGQLVRENVAGLLPADCAFEWGSNEDGLAFIIKSPTGTSCILEVATSPELRKGAPMSGEDMAPFYDWLRTEREARVNAGLAEVWTGIPDRDGRDTVGQVEDRLRGLKGFNAKSYAAIAEIWRNKVDDEAKRTLHYTDDLGGHFLEDPARFARRTQSLLQSSVEAFHGYHS